MAVLSGLSIACGNGGNGKDNSDPAALLAGEFEGLTIKRSSEVRTFVGEALYEHINGGAEIYHLYGFTTVATAYYTDAAGVEILADLFQFESADGAWGLYSIMRPPAPQLVAMGIEGFATATSLDLVKGKYLLRLTAYEETPETAATLSDLAGALVGDIPGTTEKPAKFALFPTKAALTAGGTIHAEAFLGLQTIDDVYSRRYVIGEDTVTLFLTDDPAGTKFDYWAGQVESEAMVTGIESDFAFTDGRQLKTEHSYYGKIVAGSKGNLLAGLINYGPDCDSLLNEWLAALP
jgi:hypothetical protein